MIKPEYLCDVCGKKLPTKMGQPPIGQVEIICETGTTKEWNTKGLFQHLCKECALIIDNNIAQAKTEVLNGIIERDRRKN